MLSFTIHIISIILLITAQFSFSQSAAKADAGYNIQKADSSRLILSAQNDDYNPDVRLLNDDILEKYKNDPDFNYDNKNKEPDDLISKIKNWINQQLIAIQSTKTFSTILDYVYYGLMVIALILILRGLIKADRRGILFGGKVTEEITLSEKSENLDQIDFDDLIFKATENKQFKLAVRYLFLKSLKLLSDEEIITLNINKTNRQYLSEVKSSHIARAFRNIIVRFEWIWFGDFPVNEEMMEISTREFNELFVLIKS